MIFVTVGTHEQQFNRLIEEIDKLVEFGYIKEEVIIQSGFSTYNVKNCKSEKIITYQQMIKNIKDARIVITHGGPATFIMPLQMGKIPVVVPRMKKYGEHVNDHQLNFAKIVELRLGNVILVEQIEELRKVLSNYDNIIKKMPKELISNNRKFNLEFEKIVEDILK